MAQAVKDNTARENRRKFLEGTVVSDKMNKTRVVQVVWSAQHTKYGKVMRRLIKYKAHDEKNAAKAGDFVEIMETRPISKDKRWTITKVLKKGEK